MSNWENRPLRGSQMLYAALDAYCLLLLWQILQPMTDELNIFVTTEVSVSSDSRKKLVNTDCSHCSLRY